MRWWYSRSFKSFYPTQLLAFYLLLLTTSPTSMHLATLQMKGRWVSNINVWFPFMYSPKWNCYFQNRIIVYCSVSQFISVWDLYISRIGLPILLQEYKNCSQTHKCGIWDWGRAIFRKGIHKWDFCCSVGRNSRMVANRCSVDNSSIRGTCNKVFPLSTVGQLNTHSHILIILVTACDD